MFLSLNSEIQSKGQGVISVALLAQDMVSRTSGLGCSML